jgi:hypothetical protein
VGSKNQDEELRKPFNFSLPGRPFLLRLGGRALSAASGWPKGDMRTPRPLPKLLIAGAAFLVALTLHPQHAAGQSPAQASSPQQASSAPLRPIETEQRLGPFAIGGQMYAVVTHEMSVSGASNTKFSATLVELEIRDAGATVVYQESFPSDVQDGHFAQKLSASASVLAGAGGAALVIRFLEGSAAVGEGESWQVFGLVNGKLTPFGALLPLGQGGGTVGGVLTGVMVGGGIDVEPLVSTAEELEFRAWTGNFFVYIPVRMDWAQGQWTEGEQCFELNGGSLRQRGCNLRVAAKAQPQVGGSIVTLYAEPVEDRYNAQQVSVGSGSTVEFLGALAVVNWKGSGERIACSFDGLWLRVRIEGKEGWVHSEAEFAALGLPAASPPQ